MLLSSAERLQATPATAAADAALAIGRAALWALLAAKVVSSWGVQWDIHALVPGAAETLAALVVTFVAALAGGFLAGRLAALLDPEPQPGG